MAPKKSVQATGDPVLNFIAVYSTNSCKLRVKRIVKTQGKLEFLHVDPSTVFSKIQRLNTTKMTNGGVTTDKTSLKYLL